MTKQDIKKLLAFFTDSSDRDLKTFKSLKKLKRYDAALFFLHLAIEKRLKALFIRRMSTHPPLSHDLVFLAGRSATNPSEQIIAFLKVISTFNIETRYENEKFDFYKLATKSYLDEWERKGNTVLLWIQDQQNQP